MIGLLSKIVSLAKSTLPTGVMHVTIWHYKALLMTAGLFEVGVYALPLKVLIYDCIKLAGHYTRYSLEMIEQIRKKSFKENFVFPRGKIALESINYPRDHPHQNHKKSGKQ